MRTFALLAALLTIGSPAAAGVAPHSSRFGKIFFDSRGFVLYAFTKDGKGRSACYGTCAKAWPPYLVKTAPRGKLVGTTRRRDGRLQVTYAGRPLYYYVGDTQPRQILCQNVSEYGGLWLVVKPDGSLVR